MNKERLEENVGLSIVVVLGIIFFLIIGYVVKKLYSSTPVEKYKEIEQIDKTNIVLDTEVKLLDSIKNDKIIEVKNLNDDSTLVLFYKLISK